jgi:tRNA pseudouridine38-40 synthase
MTQRYRLDISYDGKRYKGWQRLGPGDKAETVQGKIETALSRILDKSIEIEGAGRTDAGVHALDQVATFSTEARIDTKSILEELNFYLPEDIAVQKLSLVYTGFHARYSATSKTYQYRILNASIPDPFLHRYALYLAQTLNVELMRKASADFLGEHDFTAFTTAKSKKKSMVRKIEFIEILTQDRPGGRDIQIRIKANGFLHNMARKMVGTLIETGLGRVPETRVREMLESLDRSLSSELAPPHGLYLESVAYLAAEKLLKSKSEDTTD